MSERNRKLDALLAKSMPDIEAQWESRREAERDAITVSTTNAVDAAITAYFERLKALSDPASDTQILAEMQRLYATLNELNDTNDYGLLETGERELLVPIFIEAAEICGIDSAKYDGEPGGEYRDF